MSDIAIKVESVSKRYRIGLKEELHDTFLGSVTSWIKSPISNFRKVRSLSTFSDDGDSRDIIWALRDVSFEVKHGEVLGIIGKNGAGKSTLLKILCRITEPTTGRATVNGRVASVLGVGTGFHPELTGSQNVYLNGSILGMTKIEIDRKFDEIVHFSGIEKFIDTPVKRYSSGMYVRLAFAVAAHLDPEILLIDEVLAVGDIEFQKKCIGKMNEVAKAGRTVLFVSHNMGLIGRLCNSAMLISNGRLARFSNVREVINEYVVESGGPWGRSNMSNKSEVDRAKIEFPADSSKQANIRLIRILDSEDEQGSVLDRSKSFKIEISYDVNEPINAYASATLSTLDETTRIINSREIGSVQHTEVKREIGTYVSTVEFPGGILNAGLYYARVGVKYVGISYDRRPSPSFELVDYGDVGNYQTALGTDKKDKRGVLAFQLNWTSRQL